MEIENKSGITSHVLVCDVSDNGQLYYYSGYFKMTRPHNTNNYTGALKVQFKDEAQTLCDEMNTLKTGFTYHVEEHAYS